MDKYDSPEYEPWVYKCLACKHCYTTKDDDDTLKCRLRKGCRFDPVEEPEREEDEA